MTTEEAQATVGRFMQAIVEERFDDARGLLHEEFVVYEAGGVPYGGEYHSPQGFFELLGKMNEGLVLTLGRPPVSRGGRHRRDTLPAEIHRSGLRRECRDEFGRNLHGA